MDVVGNPDIAAYHIIYPWFQGNLAHVEVTFDFSEGDEPVVETIQQLILLLKSERFER